MKTRSDAILHPAQAAYLDALLPDREPILAAMEAAAEADGVPISDPEVGALLEVLARARCGTAGGRILEIGTAIGYGTLCLARGAPGATVVSVDPDPERLAAARRHLEAAGVAARVELLERPALEALPELAGPFDLAYLDAVKTEYRAYLDLVVPRLAPGGLLVADNLLWKGWVADPPAEAARDPSTEALRQFNRAFVGHPQLRALVLPLGDGLGIGVRR